MSTENSSDQLFNNSVKILTDLISFKTISGEDNSSLINYCDEILKKIGEEAAETIIAAKSDNDNELIHEIADLWFHCLILLSKKNLCVVDVVDELRRREGISGIEEKNNRE